MAVLAGRGVALGRAESEATSGRSNADVSQREDLANFISMITRDETPFMSSIGKTKATAIYHEWQTDELAAPGNSRIGEGTDYQLPNDNDNPFSDAQSTLNSVTSIADGGTFNIVGPSRTRIGNYCQINGKTISVSGTRRAIDQAGVADEYAYQLKKRGTELRRDIERDLVHSFNVASGGTSARTFGGYQAWINSPATVETVGNIILPGQTGHSNTTNNSAGNGAEKPELSAAVERGALSLSSIDSVMQSIYEEGGKASKIMLSPKLRRDFSDLMVTDSGVRRNIDMDGKLRQSVDVYMSDFGDLMVVPNYIMGLTHDRNLSVNTTVRNVNLRDFSALVYDPMWFSIATLRPLQEVDVGQRGDSTVGMMVEECTFEVKNPVGCGAIYGLE